VRSKVTKRCRTGRETICSKYTFTISAQKQWQEPGAWLEGAEVDSVEVNTQHIHAHTHSKKGKQWQHIENSSLIWFEQTYLPGNLPNYVLWSNKSNINHQLKKNKPAWGQIDWCCFYCFVRNSRISQWNSVHYRYSHLWWCYVCPTYCQPFRDHLLSWLMAVALLTFHFKLGVPGAVTSCATCKNFQQTARVSDKQLFIFKFSSAVQPWWAARKGVCGRARVGKWAARQQQLRNAWWMQADYCCTCSVVVVYSCVCSQPSAFTSRRDTTSWLALISRHAPCHKHLFLLQKFHFRRIPRGLPRRPVLGGRV